MIIEKLADLLRDTIYGKEHFLRQTTAELIHSTDTGATMALDATVKFTQINVNELKLILDDVERACIESLQMKIELDAANNKIKQLEATASARSWEGQVDRMGGQYTLEELYDPNRTNWIEP